MNDEDGYCIDVLNEEGQKNKKNPAYWTKEVPGVLYVDKTFEEKGNDSYIESYHLTKISPVCYTI